MILRCLLDGLLLDARLCAHPPLLVAFDGAEPFGLEAVEAMFYEVVCATDQELLDLEEAHYRLLRCADDFERTEPG